MGRLPPDVDGRQNTEAFVRAYNGAKYATWASLPHRLHEHEHELVARFVPDTRAQIATIGCGAGRETFGLHDRGYSKTVGFDCAPALLACAEEENRRRGTRLPFVQAWAQNLPVSDGVFDAVTMFTNVFGHITPEAARRSALLEMRRVLRPGGILLLEVTSLSHIYRYRLALYLLNTWRRIHNPANLEPYDKLVASARAAGRSQRDAPRSHWFTEHSVRREAEQAGFQVIRLSTVNEIVRNPHADATRFWGEGRICLVARPSGVVCSRSVTDAAAHQWPCRPVRRARPGGWSCRLHSDFKNWIRSAFSLSLSANFSTCE